MECAIGLPRPLLRLFFLNWKLEKIWTVTCGVKGWRPMFFGWSGVGVAAVIDVDVVAAVLNRSRTWCWWKPTVPVLFLLLVLVFFFKNVFNYLFSKSRSLSGAGPGLRKWPAFFRLNIL